MELAKQKREPAERHSHDKEVKVWSSYRRLMSASVFFLFKYVDFCDGEIVPGELMGQNL